MIWLKEWKWKKIGDNNYKRDGNEKIGGNNYIRVWNRSIDEESNDPRNRDWII